MHDSRIIPNTMATSPMTEKTLVLDIDECCIHTYAEEGVDDPEIMLPHNVGLRSRFFEIEFSGVEPLWGVKRPYLDQFLAFAGRYFKLIVVWSAGEKEYVLAIVKELFRDHRQPDLILTRDDCIGDMRSYHKPLYVLKKRMPDLDLRQVLALDDRESNFKDNPDNGLTIPPFSPCPQSGFEEKDHYLSHVIDWLMIPTVRNCKDMTKLDKRRVFQSRKPSPLEKHKQHLSYSHTCCFGPMSTYTT